MNCSEHVMFWQYLERGCHLFSVLVTVMAFQSCDCTVHFEIYDNLHINCTSEKLQKAAE